MYKSNPNGQDRQDSDLVRQVDKDRVADVKEDIDTLLVFVSSLLFHTNFETDLQ